MTSGRGLPRSSVSQSYVFTPQAAPSHISLWHADVSEVPKPGHRVVPSMSALPPKADIAGRQLDVRFVPIADIIVRARLQPAVGGKEFVPHAHDCIGRFFKIDVFGGRCLRNNTSSCLKCIALKGAGLESRH
jgi:hypothetical protein